MKSKAGCLFLPLAALAVFVPSLVAMLVFRSADASAFVGLGALLLFSVGAPVLVVLGRWFWLGSLAAVLSWLGLFLGLAAASELAHPGGMGEGGMVLLFPMMVFPPALGLAGLVRLVMWLRARAARAPEGPPGS